MKHHCAVIGNHEISLDHAPCALSSNTNNKLCTIVLFNNCVLEDPISYFRVRDISKRQTRSMAMLCLQLRPPPEQLRSPPEQLRPPPEQLRPPSEQLFSPPEQRDRMLADILDHALFL